MYTIKARYYAHPDCFGETFILTSDNGDKDLRLEIGTKVNIVPKKLIKDVPEQSSMLTDYIK